MRSKNRLSRRALLGGLAGVGGAAVLSAVLPTHRALSALPNNPDVVIIGAGMAGLAAAKALMADGFEVVVVEARNRIGGRAYAPSDAFGLPFDHGCAWLHSADENPVTEIAENFGFEFFDDSDPEWWLYRDGEEGSEDDYDDAENAYGRLGRAIEDAADEGYDVSSAEFQPSGWPGELAASLEGPMEAGVDLKDLSTADVASQIGTGVEWLVPGGLGNVVARFGDGVPVSLQTAVSSVEWGGTGVTVRTDKGDIQAEAVLVTASTGVLGAGMIGFTPDLPDWKQQAIADVPMGLLDKIALRLKRNILEAEPTTHLSQVRSAGVFNGWLLNTFDANLAVGFVGGSDAWALEQEGEAAMHAFGVQVLKEMFGNDIEAELEPASVITRWGADPLAMGAYSASKPGRNKSRRKLAKPVGDRVFFAGEACIPKWATQVSGAYLSGLEAAEDIAEIIG